MTTILLLTLFSAAAVTGWWNAVHGDRGASGSTGLGVAGALIAVMGLILRAFVHEADPDADVLMWLPVWAGSFFALQAATTIGVQLWTETSRLRLSGRLG